ncbi:VRR-NUC domain-containing protein [Psychrobacter celer]|uniref:VRR-NUC domain-containing protein n=1 Tax=Psychrobacter celer TaxID=306572 RepID=UPI003FD04314
MITEKDIEQYLVKQAQKGTDWQIRKAQWVGHNHCPDRLIMTPDITVWVEVKAPGKVPRAGQEREHTRMRRAGQIVVSVSTKGEVDQLIKDMHHAKSK